MSNEIFKIFENRNGICNNMKKITCFQIIVFHNSSFNSLNYFWINLTFLKFFVIQVIYFWRYRVIIIVYFWYAFLIAYHPYPIKIHAWTFSIYEQFEEKRNFNFHWIWKMILSIDLNLHINILCYIS